MLSSGCRVGAGANVLQRVIDEKSAIQVNRPEKIYPTDRRLKIPLVDPYRRIIGSGCQTQQSRFRAFAMISDRVLVDVAPDAIDRDSAGFVCELLRIAVETLQEGAAHAESDIGEAEPIRHDAIKKLCDAAVIDAVALQYPNLS